MLAATEKQEQQLIWSSVAELRVGGCLTYEVFYLTVVAETGQKEAEQGCGVVGKGECLLLGESFTAREGLETL